MKAMILAAGRGERMRPLTEHTPKPLLQAGGKPLLQYHLEALAKAGIEKVVINIAYLGEQIQAYFGDRFDYVSDNKTTTIRIVYSPEPEPLETAGAIQHALSFLGEAPFMLINGDIWTDYPLENLRLHNLGNALGHLVLVANPDHHPEGDFAIEAGKLSLNKQGQNFTFSGVSLLNPKLVSSYTQRRAIFPLGEVLRAAALKSQISAEYYAGQWQDIGTVMRLQNLDNYLKSNG